MEREFIILPTFESKWKDLGLTDEDLRELENQILENPDGPPVIPGTGGIRKIRIKLPGRGKRGGGRVIYIDFVIQKQIFFLTAYAKNEKENLSPSEKKALKSLVDLLKEQL
jgi:hypothetical protein